MTIISFIYEGYEISKWEFAQFIPRQGDWVKVHEEADGKDYYCLVNVVRWNSSKKVEVHLSNRRVKQ